MPWREKDEGCLETKKRQTGEVSESNWRPEELLFAMCWWFSSTEVSQFLRDSEAGRGGARDHLQITGAAGVCVVGSAQSIEV